MTNAINNMIIGLTADAGLRARAAIVAGAFGEGRTLPTFRLLRS
jgi:hypothetical protein